MATSILLLLSGALLLYAGAESLVRGSASAAARLGVKPLVIGLTVVAFGTSMPELVVSVQASLDGRGSLAAGNVVGSNIGNVALILGISSLIRPPRVQMQLLRFDVPLVIGTTIVASLFMLDRHVGRAEGVVLVGSLLLYLWLSLRMAARERPGVVDEFHSGVPRKTGSGGLDVALICGGLALLVGGGHVLLSGAVAIADRLGMSEGVIGLTLVAVGTSLPELATSVVAALRGEGDLAVGNVVGSNLFNLLGILGVSATLRPLADLDVGLMSLVVMLVVSFALVPVMVSGRRVSRIEGALLLLSYVAYVTLVLL